MYKKILCALSGIVVGISVFFPYMSASFLGTTLSISLMDTKNRAVYIVIALAVIAVVFSLIGKYVLSALAGLVSLVFFFVVNSRITSSTGSFASLAKSVLHHGPGYYMLLIGSIALIVFSLLGIIEGMQRPASADDSSV